MLNSLTKNQTLANLSMPGFSFSVGLDLSVSASCILQAQHSTQLVATLSTLCRVLHCSLFTLQAALRACTWPQNLLAGSSSGRCAGALALNPNRHRSVRCHLCWPGRLELYHVVWDLTMRERDRDPLHPFSQRWPLSCSVRLCAHHHRALHSLPKAHANVGSH